MVAALLISVWGSLVWLAVFAPVSRWFGPGGQAPRDVLLDSSVAGCVRVRGKGRSVDRPGSGLGP